METSDPCARKPPITLTRHPGSHLTGQESAETAPRLSLGHESAYRRQLCSFFWCGRRFRTRRREIVLPAGAMTPPSWLACTFRRRRRLRGTDAAHPAHRWRHTLRTCPQPAIKGLRDTDGLHATCTQAPAGRPAAIAVYRSRSSSWGLPQVLHMPPSACTSAHWHMISPDRAQ